MFKYLAVIMDSFREAFASRLMWVVLVLITLLLLVIAPLGYHEVVTWRLGDNDDARLAAIHGYDSRPSQ